MKLLHPWPYQEAFIELHREVVILWRVCLSIGALLRKSDLQITPNLAEKIL